MKKGYTVSELLICLGILGILSAVLVPTVINAMPNKNIVMLKKAYSIITRNITDMINDEDLFGDDGFADNREIFINGVSYGGDKDDYKFARLFARNLNLADSPSYSQDKEKKEFSSNFTTTDGIQWQIQNFNNQVITIKIDTNGPDGPNCVVKAPKGDDKGDDCNNNPDIFDFIISTNGQISTIKPTRDLIKSTKMRVN